MTRPGSPITRIERLGRARARHERRAIVERLRHAREDAGLSQRALARAAGLGVSTICEIEQDDREPTIEVLARISAALGGELSVRFYPGTGPVIRDHLQGAIVECLVGVIAPAWKAGLEVWVATPLRGVIDVVLTRDDASLMVACEVHSELRRLEQQIRWAVAKAEALPMDGASSVSRALLLRATKSNRAVAASYPGLLGTAYPARHIDAVESLRSGAPWPGAAILWFDVVAGVATMRNRPPPDVKVGR
jgi:transcriptional regulator with XRE-family HTH domain